MELFRLLTFIIHCYKHPFLTFLGGEKNTFLIEEIRTFSANVHFAKIGWIVEAKMFCCLLVAKKFSLEWSEQKTDREKKSLNGLVIRALGWAEKLYPEGGIQL